jgi:hypothetical protein
VSPFARFPDEVRRLFWDVDPDSVDLERHRDYVLQRVMTRGGWIAMRWLRTAYPDAALADFLRRKGTTPPGMTPARWSEIKADFEAWFAASERTHSG